MSASAQLRVQANVWGKTDNRIAVLVLEGFGARDRDGDNLLVRAVLQAGMKHVGDLGELFLPTPAGWLVRLDPGGLLSLEWPRGSLLVKSAPVDLPPVWRWAANRTGKVVTLVKSGENLPLQVIAERGNLVGAAVGFLDKSVAQERPAS